MLFPSLLLPTDFSWGLSHQQLLYQISSTIATAAVYPPPFFILSSSSFFLLSSPTAASFDFAGSDQCRHRYGTPNCRVRVMEVSTPIEQSATVRLSQRNGSCSPNQYREIIFWLHRFSIIYLL
ncbi:hypothetical protein PVK06_021546 [Gossypium arboreum]|uniref:Uncharacterized protein n=1 Tax=Gossypium arboreum TaxID=29729 RepID=A0ABR0PR17_GOSAR|nr:hypothetical protein PVK06_021546 [Gossypium arboreum]